MNGKKSDEIKAMLGLNNNIKYKDFVIISSEKIRDCIKNEHRIQQFEIELPIALKNSSIVIRKINAYHCKECKLYFITEKDYGEIQNQGSMLCRHMTWKEYKDYITNAEGGFVYFNKESVLKQYGYSVSQVDGLKENERQAILTYIIEISPKDEKGNIWNRDMIVWFLKQQIEMHPHHEKAIEKWESDLNFLEDYSYNNPIIYKVRRVIRD